MNMISNDLILRCERYMQECLKEDMAHDPQHIYRVLKLAMDIADHEETADRGILVIACLLHDIGRKAQREDPSLCHAEVGGEMAYRFLIQQGIGPEIAGAVRDAIQAHRFRSRHKPETIEAKILFDADTIDATGAIGIARSLQYEGNGAIPIYHVDQDGTLLLGGTNQPDSFLREYEFKLKNLYDRLYTPQAQEIAYKRRLAAQQFCEALKSEITEGHTTLHSVLKRLSAEIIPAKNLEI